MTPEENYADITQMQAHWNKLWRDKRRWIIVDEGDETYSIHEHMIDGVAPPTIKSDKRLIAARLLQLLQIGPVAPQDYSEEHCVGKIDYKPADILELNPVREIKCDICGDYHRGDEIPYVCQTGDGI